MPYKSRQQEKWAHTPAGEAALGGPAKVAEWDAASKGKSLPKRAGFVMADQGRKASARAAKGKRK